MHRSAHTPDRNLVTWSLCVLLTWEGTVPAPCNRLAGLESPSWPHFPQEILALCLPGRIQAASADLPHVTERGRVPVAGGGGVHSAGAPPPERHLSPGLDQSLRAQARHGSSEGGCFGRNGIIPLDTRSESHPGTFQERQEPRAS